MQARNQGGRVEGVRWTPLSPKMGVQRRIIVWILIILAVFEMINLFLINLINKIKCSNFNHISIFIQNFKFFLILAISVMLQILNIFSDLCNVTNT